MRSILAANLIALLNEHYKELPNITARQRKLSEEAGKTPTFSTVQRICKQEVGASLDNIEAIANVFGLSAYQLLVPNLSATNPGVVAGATKEEQRLYAGWRKTRLKSAPNLPEMEIGAK